MSSITRTPLVAALRSTTSSARAQALAGLDAWFDTLRAPGGYGGPVVHWWRHSLLYAGTGLDWRYEGIITGYLSLWRCSGEARWLAKAKRAGDDLCAGQCGDSHYAASAFEINPASGGTPHEPGCDAALLELARALHAAGDPAWPTYAAAAEHNIQTFIIGQLWSEPMAAVRDNPFGAAFVPNKACTAAEALFLLAEIRSDAEIAERYALPTLQRVCAYQVRGGVYDGAIVQNSFGEQRVEKYLPIYIARCVPGLLAAYRFTGAACWADAALRALAFIGRHLSAEGHLPTVIYPDGSVNLWPSWIAPLGDVLRAADMLRPLGGKVDALSVEQRILAWQSPGGGVPTAVGFAAQHGGRPGRMLDFRDVLPVAGWCDKAFRALAARCESSLPVATSESYETPCQMLGQLCTFMETPERIELRRGRRTRYRWLKGQPWAEAAPEFWLP
ncbi:MAG: hypothetical protein HGA65_03940 [Oscillochloris sp.]|nr:hypothetical protein [Oscillochloris sp.]